MIHELVDPVIEANPKLVEQEKNRLFREAMGSWARHILRSDSDSVRTTQLILPLELGTLSLPANIPTWPRGKKTGEASWVETHDSSYTQLGAEIARLEAHTRETHQLRGLKRVHAYLAPHMADRPNMKIGPVLARLAKGERTDEKQA